jgi:hypothetical protein
MTKFPVTWTDGDGNTQHGEAEMVFSTLGTTAPYLAAVTTHTQNVQNLVMAVKNLEAQVNLAGGWFAPASSPAAPVPNANGKISVGDGLRKAAAHARQIVTDEPTSEP